MDNVRTQFVLTDVKIGLTFLQIARSTLNPETASRNVANARRALDVVMREISTLRANRQQIGEIMAKFNLLKYELHEFELRD